MNIGQLLRLGQLSRLRTIGTTTVVRSLLTVPTLICRVSAPTEENLTYLLPGNSFILGRREDSVIRKTNSLIFGCFLLVVAALSATPLILFDAKAQTAGPSATISGQGVLNTIMCGPSTISTQSTTIVFSVSKTTGTFSGTWTISGYKVIPGPILIPFAISGTLNGGQLFSNSYKLTGMENVDELCTGILPKFVGGTTTISGLCGTGVQINFKNFVVNANGQNGLTGPFTQTATFTGNVACA